MIEGFFGKYIWDSFYIFLFLYWILSPIQFLKDGTKWNQWLTFCESSLLFWFLWVLSGFSSKFTNSIVMVVIVMNNFSSFYSSFGDSCKFFRVFLQVWRFKIERRPFGNLLEFFWLFRYSDFQGLNRDSRDSFKDSLTSCWSGLSQTISMNLTIEIR